MSYNLLWIRLPHLYFNLLNLNTTTICFNSPWSRVSVLVSHLPRSIRVDELVVDVLGSRRQAGPGCALVLFTGQPELQVLLAELGAQEPAERLDARCTQKLSLERRRELIKVKSLRKSSHACCWAETPGREAAAPHALWRKQSKRLLLVQLVYVLRRVLYKVNLIDSIYGIISITITYIT